MPNQKKPLGFRGFAFMATLIAALVGIFLLYLYNAPPAHPATSARATAPDGPAAPYPVTITPKWPDKVVSGTAATYTFVVKNISNKLQRGIYILLATTSLEGRSREFQPFHGGMATRFSLRPGKSITVWAKLLVPTPPANAPPKASLNFTIDFGMGTKPPRLVLIPSSSS